MPNRKKINGKFLRDEIQVKKNQNFGVALLENGLGMRNQENIKK